MEGTGESNAENSGSILDIKGDENERFRIDEEDEGKNKVTAWVIWKISEKVAAKKAVSASGS